MVRHNTVIPDETHAMLLEMLSHFKLPVPCGLFKAATRSVFADTRESHHGVLN